jgi:drug/metabolite transporter (DMT)-like permease
MDELEEGSTDARRIAFRRAILIGVVCGSGSFVFGKSIENAMIDGVIVTLGGLVAWTTYHLISRRTDGLMLVAMNTLPIWRRPADPWLPTLVITGLAMLGVGLVMGLVNRPQRESVPDRDSIWWDADLDGPR